MQTPVLGVRNRLACLGGGGGQRVLLSVLTVAEIGPIARVVDLAERGSSPQNAGLEDRNGGWDLHCALAFKILDDYSQKNDTRAS